jgi:predicted ATPase
MITQLRLQNFKGWRDTGNIRMAPLTLFFGANSSGKSSIGQFLMLLKQTVESPDRKTVFYPGGKNSAVQLGSYKELVFGRDAKNKVVFDYEWRLPERLEIVDPLTGKSFAGDNIVFSAEVGGNGAEFSMSQNRLNYLLKNEDKETLSIGMEKKNSGGDEYEVSAKHYKLKKKGGRQWSPGAPVRFYGFPDEVVAYHQNAGFVQMLNLEQENFFRRISYLGPLRTKAERLYSWAGNEPESVGYSGENTVAAILAAKARKINFVQRGRSLPFEAVVANALEKMGLIEEFEVKSISKERHEYEVKVRTKGSNTWVDIPDVGFGVSQVLPVLVQCFYAPKDSIIIMEQPEIHLHPRAQSALADVMLDAVNARENGKPRNIQLIIETHSEHFLRRLQRRIAENENGRMHDAVAAYFANVSKMPATLDNLQIDPFGDILNWPENFFGDEMADIAGQAEAALKRKIKSAQKKDAPK